MFKGPEKSFTCMNFSELKATGEIGSKAMTDPATKDLGFTEF